MVKTIPVSFRMSQEDAEFLAGLQIEDAVTLSEKVRAIIKESRHRHQQKTDYETYLKFMSDVLNGLNKQIKLAEMKVESHSEIVAYFTEWSIESFAFIASMQQEDALDEAILKTLEDGILTRIFRLFEIVARMGVTSTAPCYNKQIITKNFSEILELIQLIVEQNINKK